MTLKRVPTLRLVTTGLHSQTTQELLIPNVHFAANMFFFLYKYVLNLILTLNGVFVTRAATFSSVKDRITFPITPVSLPRAKGAMQQITH